MMRRPSRHTAQFGWSESAIVLGLLLTLAVPPPLLDLWGFGYSTATGAPWTKVHPGSDLIVLGVLTMALRDVTPLAWATAQCRRFPGTATFALTTAFLIVYVVLVQHAPFTPLIDTFLVPAVLLVGLVHFDRTWQSRLESVLHEFLNINAVLGIVEYVSGWRLIPVSLGGIEQTAEVEARAFGLLGHPLSSAGTAGLYAVILIVGGGTRLPAAFRWPVLALQFLALAAFGGRTALVMAVACLAVTGTIGLLRHLGGGTMDLRALGVALLGAPLFIGAVAAAANSGFFDTVLTRFVDDNGSAQARQTIFDLFGFMSWQDLLLGPDQERLSTLLNYLGIEAGVESFWLGMLFFCGLLPSLVFFVGFGLFLRDVLSQARGSAVVALLFFLGIASSSVSLSAKTSMLSHFVAMVIVLMPRHAAPALSPSGVRLRPTVLAAT